MNLGLPRLTLNNLVYLGAIYGKLNYLCLTLVKLSETKLFKLNLVILEYTKLYLPKLCYIILYYIKHVYIRLNLAKVSY
jgi:hypothetical protein